MTSPRDPAVHMIPVDQITVINSRARGQAKFRQIISNISNLGLKKPVTVARRPNRDGEPHYDLVCGQGRLEAYIALGQKEIPAMIVEAQKEDLFLMSLAENLARRQWTSLDLARDILAMKERGYAVPEIARKVDLTARYVGGVIRLLKRGEKQLLAAVEWGRIPMSVAIAIAESDDHEVQAAMAEAYRKGELRGKALLSARRLLERRRAKAAETPGQPKSTMSADALVNAYRKEASRQKLLVARARATETRLRFIVSAMKRLLADDGFVTLLRAEELRTMPQYLATQAAGREVKHGA